MPEKNLSAGSNKLVDARSPYLLQHAGNPVHWWPWCDQAFAEARQRDCPVFLSIGYSTCHWCHVMEHESFENDETAALLNQDFVSIKVDREERPDIDRTYMAYIMATTGSGGWPMSVWLTPDGKPFFGGTYFPPDDRYGRPGFPRLLKELSRLWQEDRSRLLEHSSKVILALQQSQQASLATDETEIDTTAIATQLTSQLSASFDDVYGGFGSAPKFPSPPTLAFLARCAATSQTTTEQADRVRNMVVTTLSKMADGGINDHLGGGFHRYSVDRTWHVPHFEKMLYDQAQLISLYLDAFQMTEAEEFLKVAGATIDYVLRDLAHPDGGFYSAEDADSLPDQETDKKQEGAFFVWEYQEVHRLLGDHAQLFSAAYTVKPAGNVAAENDPHHELTNKNVLIRSAGNAELAQKFNMPVSTVEAQLQACKKILFDYRLTRPRPHRDDKILTAWNGMMIAALARASHALKRTDVLAAAINAAAFIRKSLSDADNGNQSLLYRSWRNGHGNLTAFPDDYAQMINGLLQLYMAAGDQQWLAWAIDLQSAMDQKFRRPDGSYTGSDGSDPNLPVVLSDDHDGVEPTATSQTIINFATLAALTGNKNYRTQALATAAAFSERLKNAPSALPALLSGLLALDSEPKQVVINQGTDNSDPSELQHELTRHFLPFSVTLFADHSADSELFGPTAEILQAAANDNRAAARVCQNYSCQLPAYSASELHDILTQDS